MKYRDVFLSKVHVADLERDLTQTRRRSVRFAFCIDTGAPKSVIGLPELKLISRNLGYTILR